MKILVDFDNLPPAVRADGPLYVADRVLHALPAVVVATVPSLDFRLYGGWYDWSKPTRLAQNLAAQIRSSFPQMRHAGSGAAQSHIRLTAELAYALIALPKKHLLATVRPRRTDRLRCDHPHLRGCTVAPCPLVAMHDFLDLGACQTTGCTMTTCRLLPQRLEQKLVDTMLVSDLITLSHAGEKNIGVVSNDDDMWPGVLIAMQAGSRVFHVLTRDPSRSTIGYLADSTGAYTPCRL